MKNDSNPIIRSEKVTVDTRIYTVLEGGKKSGKVYLAAIAPDTSGIW